MDNLTEALQSTRLNDEPEELEQLVFNPQPDTGIEDTVLDNIPRYLFRLASPKSDGTTDERWVRSAAAVDNDPSSLEDIFSNLDIDKREKIANILKLHLRWWPKDGVQDNFVSWTSSLLFAIQYIYYRHYKDGTSLDEIKLYVVDTTRFLRGTFMRDLDLLDIFGGFDHNLQNLQSLRNGDTWYFGEYLSQGSLKIENKCQVIPADVLFERNRLRRIQPQFANIHRGERQRAPTWANEVIRLRRAIWPLPSPSTSAPTGMGDRLQAIEEIMQHVVPDWRFPIAIHFAALIGPDIPRVEMASRNVGFLDSQSWSFPCELFETILLGRTKIAHENCLIRSTSTRGIPTLEFSSRGTRFDS